MILRVSILVITSVAAFAVSPLNTKRLKQHNSTVPLSTGKDCSNGDKFEDNTSEEEETEVINSNNVEKVLNPNLATKMEHSHNLIRELEKKRVRLEAKLLDLYAQKEKLSYIVCLHRNLDDKAADIEKLNFRIHALNGEIKGLQDVIGKGSLAAKQLEMANKAIEEMEMKNGRASQVKRQILVVKEQLSGFTANEISASAFVKKRFEDVKNVELQGFQMRRRNKELELEKRELLLKLYASQAKISALSDMTERKTIAKISELRHANENLSKEVERLQKSTFDIVEEIVYQRWLNACLKAEIQDHQTSPTKTLRKELQKPSDNKPRELTPQYSDMNSTSSSCYTSSTESEETETSTIESYSSKNSSIGYSKIWRNSTDSASGVSSPDKSSTIRRFSTSMVPSNTSAMRTKLDGLSSKKDGTETMGNSELTKVRRVSFNDAIETVTSAKHVLTKPVDGIMDEKDDMVTLVTGHRSRMKAGLQSQSVMGGEKHEELLSSEIYVAKPDQSNDSGISNVIPVENEMNAHTHILPPVFAFLFFLFLILMCFLHLSARICIY